jgi:hypothetical protein
VVLLYDQIHCSLPPSAGLLKSVLSGSTAERNSDINSAEHEKCAVAFQVGASFRLFSLEIDSEPTRTFERHTAGEWSCTGMRALHDRKFVPSVRSDKFGQPFVTQTSRQGEYPC